jgi:hypothetical protein
LSGHRIHDQAELHKRLREIMHLDRQVSRKLGYNFGIRAATIEYYRRLNLVAEIEGGVSESFSMAAPA